MSVGWAVLAAGRWWRRFRDRAGYAVVSVASWFVVGVGGAFRWSCSVVDRSGVGRDVCDDGAAHG